MRTQVSAAGFVRDFSMSVALAAWLRGSMDSQDGSLSNLDFFWSDFESCPGEDRPTPTASPPCDPFRPENKIPLPEYEALGGVLDAFGLASELYSGVRRRNERERQRVRSVNEGFEKLRSMLPSEHFFEVTSQRRLSKVDVLRAAIEYIRGLQAVLR
jgi:Helix-loop-helix DNA-binding domain